MRTSPKSSSLQDMFDILGCFYYQPRIKHIIAEELPCTASTAAFFNSSASHRSKPEDFYHLGLMCFSSFVQIYTYKFVS